MTDSAKFSPATAPLLEAWLMVMRRVVFRGAPRISSTLVRSLLPDRCITRAARGYFMAIHSTEYVEACALCDCLNRHLSNLIGFLLRDGDFVIDGGANIGQFTLLSASIVGGQSSGV